MTDPDPMDPAPDLWCDPELQCTATSKQSGQRCRRTRTPGHAVCYYHGSSSPQSQAAAQRRLAKIRAEGEVAALLEQLGLGDEVDPLEVVLDSVRRAQTMARLLQVLVAGLSPTPGTTAAGEPAEAGKPRAALYGPDHLGDARPHALVVLYERWNAEAGRLAKLAIDAGIATIRLEREERVVDELVTAMRSFSESLGAALEQALVSAGVEPALVRQARVDAEPDAFRQALAPLATLEVDSTEVLAGPPVEGHETP